MSRSWKTHDDVINVNQLFIQRHWVQVESEALYNLYYSFYATARKDSVLPNAGWAEGPEGCLKSHKGRVDSL